MRNAAARGDGEGKTLPRCSLAQDGGRTSWSWGRIGAASARETTGTDRKRPAAKPHVKGHVAPICPGGESGVSGLIIRRPVVRVHPAPPTFPLVTAPFPPGETR